MGRKGEKKLNTTGQWGARQKIYSQRSENQTNQDKTRPDSTNFLNDNATNIGNNSSVKVLYTNIDSITNKVQRFKDRVTKICPHIICITETKLNPSDKTEDYFKIKNYNSFRKDRTSNGGGGVIILVSDHLCSEEIHYETWLDTEVIACMIKTGAKKLLCACIYRPPRSPPNYNRQVETVITSLSNTVADQYLICGDFNYPKIDWTNHTVNSSDVSDEQQFYDAVQSSF